jgi:hypothetical protein
MRDLNPQELSHVYGAGGCGGGDPGRGRHGTTKPGQKTTQRHRKTSERKRHSTTGRKHRDAC